MKKEKTIKESLDDLFKVAENFVKILEVNKISSHFEISGQDLGVPVVSDLKIKFYNPDNFKYCLTKEYTHINIGDIVIGQYGTVSYKIALTHNDIDLITKKAIEVYEEFEKFAFGSLYEKELIRLRNEIRMHNLRLKQAKLKYSETQTIIDKYKS